MLATLTIEEGRPPIDILTLDELRANLKLAMDHATTIGRPNIVFVTMPNGNTMSLVVGAGNETVLDFVYHHKDPPYFASKADTDDIEPYLVAYVGLVHHTELPRRNVVPMDLGMRALNDFVKDGELPPAVDWIEV
ncbi:Imm1 family immunity protein [Cognatiyoonia sp. IB215446]|uniref:Imm1 family immunity protein n=1 Tax=Cognatiyoonia sp. IB215446 TaxID=3097355 RepID=UPI002A0E1EA9|nr:Imm1 family immunity protein [Cognatiyoonia sp. IB215446]MDX8350604.1 Imm1 family immunity protein [Cognatiyoonia sp. IB215446]